MELAFPLEARATTAIEAYPAVAVKLFFHQRCQSLKAKARRGDIEEL